MQNYIPDVNLFNLSGPPQWWLKKLWDFDASLVVVPSKQNCLYRLAQRRPPNLSVRITNDVLFKDSDTRMLASYGLIPVTSILATANWSNPFLFQELANRAPHRNGGAEKVTQMLEAQEAEADAKKQAKTDEHLHYLGKDAWKLYLKKLGLRGYLDLSTGQQVSRNPPSPSLKGGR